MSSKSARRSTDYRRKKRHFCGNQHSKNETLEPVGIDVSSASSKKLCLDSGSYQSNSSERKGYRLINLDILSEELSKYLICFYCGSKAVLKEKVLFGLVSEFYIDCDSCAMQSTFKSSPVFESSNHDYEINTRITYAMRTLGGDLLKSLFSSTILLSKVCILLMILITSYMYALSENGVKIILD
ncbi:hypothetical protein TNCT_693471 [Trichonephila clavata]|uniref:Uncharacterized protein n=1 Tax=Trichonephila clavata TaxID=2740835 RepID=A0A8X6L024_TRICU|nr:hypothetical protein TNCT_693471 [Trichonephila clavata]